MASNKLYSLNDFFNQSSEDIYAYLNANRIDTFNEDDINAACGLAKNLKVKLNGFNISTSIDIYNKEFDLIKIGDSIIVNIELKRTYRDIKQCEDNYKILSFHFPAYSSYIFQYLESTNELFIYNPKTLILEKTSFNMLDTILTTIKNPEIFTINTIKDNAYLQSEFYFNDRYILNMAQTSAKDKVIDYISSSDNKIVTISGRAGTGKSLLALDIYKSLSNSYDVKYLVGFTLNNIKDKYLIEKIGITTIKTFCSAKVECDILIIDEAQRITQYNLDIFNKFCKKKIILVGDIHQNIESEQTFLNLMDSKNPNVDHVVIDYVVRSDDSFDIFARKILNIGYKGLKGKRFKIDNIKIKMISDLEVSDFTNAVLIEPAKSPYFEDCTSKCPSMVCKKIKNFFGCALVPYTSLGNEYKNVLLFLCNGYSVRNNKIYMNQKVCYGNLKAQLYNIITRATESLTIITEDIKMYTFLKQKLNEMYKNRYYK